MKLNDKYNPSNVLICLKKVSYYENNDFCFKVGTFRSNIHTKQKNKQSLSQLYAIFVSILSFLCVFPCDTKAFFKNFSNMHRSSTPSPTKMSVLSPTKRPRITSSEQVRLELCLKKLSSSHCRKRQKFIKLGIKRGCFGIAHDVQSKNSGEID